MYCMYMYIKKFLTYYMYLKEHKYVYNCLPCFQNYYELISLLFCIKVIYLSIKV